MKTLTAPIEKTLNLSEKQKRIFIVDDDITYSYLLSFYLKHDLQYHIFCFLTGEACINEMYKKPDIVVLDYHLNTRKEDAMNGLQVLKKIKYVNPQTEVLMLSGQKNMNVAIETLRLGAYTYILKDKETFYAVKMAINSLSK